MSLNRRRFPILMLRLVHHKWFERQGLEGFAMIFPSFVSVAGSITLALLAGALFISFYRLARGPSLPDRVVALDTIGTISVGFIAAYSIMTNHPVFLDVAIVLALIAFLGTVAFARYLEKGVS